MDNTGMIQKFKSTKQYMVKSLPQLLSQSPNFPSQNQWSIPSIFFYTKFLEIRTNQYFNFIPFNANANLLFKPFCILKQSLEVNLKVKHI